MKGMRATSKSLAWNATTSRSHTSTTAEGLASTNNRAALARSIGLSSAGVYAAEIQTPASRTQSSYEILRGTAACKHMPPMTKAGIRSGGIKKQDEKLFLHCVKKSNSRKAGTRTRRRSASASRSGCSSIRTQRPVNDPNDHVWKNGGVQPQPHSHLETAPPNSLTLLHHTAMKHAPPTPKPRLIGVGVEMIASCA
jgi:hypothetical protein